MAAVFLITLCVLLSVLTCNADPAPPILPNAFTIKSKESWYYVEHNGNKILEGSCDFTEYYDYTNKRMRFDRGEGQVDYFCEMNENQKIACNLYFDSSGAMFVDYPTKSYCCQLCAIGADCTVLKPTWIEKGTYDGQQLINNRSCNVWSEKGASTVDYWSQDPNNNNTPCAYWEEANNYLMQQMYNAKSYIVGEPDPSLFVLPSNKCHTVCNNSIKAV